MTELKNIIRVEYSTEFDDYLIGVLANNTVTLISKEDGSIPFPDLIVKSIYNYSQIFFRIDDINSLSFLVDKRNGTIITPEKRLDIKFNDDTIPTEEKAKISKFYNEHWASLNDDYYIYEDDFTELVVLVKKDTFELALPEWYQNIRNFNEKIFILENENNKQVLYNSATNTFFNMQPSIIITRISSSLALIGDTKDKLRLYRIRGNQTPLVVFETHNLYLTENDFFQLRNGQYLINANNSVYLI